MYGGNEHSFVNDPDFLSVSSSKAFWKKVIERYYEKYYGIKKWHDELIYQAMSTGIITTPFGRSYSFDCSWKIPETTIKNYPVQGSSADLMAVIRTEYFNALRREKGFGTEFVLYNTVHDSIEVDSMEKHLDSLIELFYNTLETIPAVLKRDFDIDFPLIIGAEHEIK